MTTTSKNSLLSRLRRVFFRDYGASDVFPWFTPTRERRERGEGELFPEAITDGALEARYKRYQLAHVIINDVAEDCFRAGFDVMPLDPNVDKEEFSSQFDKVFSHYLRQPILKAFKCCRLYGSSSLIFFFNEQMPTIDFNQPPSVRFSGKTAEISSVTPIKKTDLSITMSNTIPKKIDQLSIYSGNGEVKLHPSRYVYLENDTIDEDGLGSSSLSPVFDLLTVQKHADWSMGQGLWRGAAGLLTLTTPAGTTSSDARAALDAVENIHAKTRLVLPPGWDAKDLTANSSTARALPEIYKIIVSQIAAGSRVPVSVLLGETKTSKKPYDPNYEGFICSLQNNFLTHILSSCFMKFQASGQLPDGDFKIIWRRFMSDPYEEAKREYMEAVARRMSPPTEVKEQKVFPAEPIYTPEGIISVIEQGKKEEREEAEEETPEATSEETSETEPAYEEVPFEQSKLYNPSEETPTEGET